MNAERPNIIMVTKDGPYNKALTFQRALPEWQVTRRDPLIDEKLIQAFAPDTGERPVFISEAKAKLDAPWVAAVCGMADIFAEEAKIVPTKDGTMYLYADTVQLIHENDGSVTIHEKPEGDPVIWAASSPQAMAQAGKNIEIVNSLTGILCDQNGISEPKTVIVRVQASMRPYTREELVTYAKGSGNKTIPNTAGGISLANGGRGFHDTQKPLVISVQDGIESKPVELLRYDTWDHVPDEALRPFICGAFEPAVVRLVSKVKTH